MMCQEDHRTLTSNTLFAAAPAEMYYVNTVSFKYSNATYFTNTTATLTGLYADFKDGMGYQQITSIGISKTYTDSTGNKPIDFKVNFSNGLTLYCHSSVNVKGENDPTARYIDTDPLPCYHRYKNPTKCGSLQRFSG